MKDLHRCWLSNTYDQLDLTASFHIFHTALYGVSVLAVGLLLDKWQSMCKYPAIPSPAEICCRFHFALVLGPNVSTAIVVV
jgi:hypothetical protein